MTYFYDGNGVKVFYGRLIMKKIYGTGPVSVGTQIVIPFARATPRNPFNNAYFGGVNNSGFVSADNQGKYTPSVTVSTVFKASFLTAAFLNSLVMSVDSRGNTDVWAILLDDTFQQEIYDGSKCMGVQIRQQSQGGPITLTMGFLSTYGYDARSNANQNPGTLFTPTTFTSSSTDAGQVMDVTQVVYAGTADLVQSLAIDLVRPQQYKMYDDGTRFALGISSGMFAGNVVVSQSTRFTSTFGSSGTINIGTTGFGVSCAALLKADEVLREFNETDRVATTSWSMYDSAAGGNPFTITAL